MDQKYRTFRRNLPFFRNESIALFENLSVSVKSISLIVILSYILSYYEPAIDALSVTPGYLVPPSFHFWTLFTEPFLEIHLWEVCVDIVTVGLCGKLLEPLWGSREMIIFFILVNFCVAVLSVAYYLFLYSVTFDPSHLFDIKIHGLAGYIAAVSVAVRQMMPDHVLVKTPLGKWTNRNVPLTVLTVSIIMWAIGILEGTYCTMFASGIVSGWIYLRFFQRHSNGSRGDPGDTFCFASFFPNVLQPPIAVLANSIFQFLVKIHVCRKHVKRFTNDGPTSIHISLPDADAERRRQKALRHLNERLGRDGSKVPLIRPESPPQDWPNEHQSPPLSPPISPPPIIMSSTSTSSSNINISQNQNNPSTSVSHTSLKNVIIPEMTIENE